MNDLRRAAEMALKQLHRDDWYLGHRSKTRADAITALQLALDDEPPVKTYAGGKPNYCTPDVDAANMSQERVDETAKGEHEPVAYVHLKEWLDGTLWPEDAFSQNPHEEMTPLYTAPPKQEYQYEVVAENADGTYTTRRIPKRDNSSLYGA